MAEKFRVMFAGLEAGVDQAHATEQLAAKLKTKDEPLIVFFKLLSSRIFPFTNF